jgi:HipA-like protein
MTEELQALSSGRRLGIVHWDRRRDRYSFRYDDAWRGDSGAFPLSLSMPFAATAHSHDTIEAFLWGLLPDNEGVLKRWGERFQVSARNAFRLLMHVGEECAGAVQLVQAEKAAEWLAAPLSRKGEMARRGGGRGAHAAFAQRPQRHAHQHGPGPLQPRRSTAENSAALRSEGRPLGACPRAAFPRRISSSPPPAISTATRRTSTSVWRWHADWASPPRHR